MAYISIQWTLEYSTPYGVLRPDVWWCRFTENCFACSLSRRRSCLTTVWPGRLTLTEFVSATGDGWWQLKSRTSPTVRVDRPTDDHDTILSLAHCYRQASIWLTCPGSSGKIYSDWSVPGHCPTWFSGPVMPLFRQHPASISRYSTVLVWQHLVISRQISDHFSCSWDVLQIFLLAWTTSP